MRYNYKFFIIVAVLILVIFQSNNVLISDENSSDKTTDLLSVRNPEYLLSGHGFNTTACGAGSPCGGDPI